jgi:DNA-directed RNA polymerase specialized sigma24 family protein
MLSDTELKKLLARWFDRGDEVALNGAFQGLWHFLQLPLGFRRALGDSEADDVRQEVLTRLLDARRGMLRGVDAPSAYAWAALRREAQSRVRVGQRRDTISSRRPLDAPPGAAGVVDVEAWLVRRLDALRAVADDLDDERRMAVLLTVAPEHLSDRDWMTIVARHPPPSPARPTVPLDRAAAGLLLYGPTPSEPSERREERFRKLLERACRQVLDAIEEDT